MDRGMVRFVATAAALAVPGLASAHPGHLADLAGHTHWVAGIAVGVAVLVGLWAGLKGRSEAAGHDDADAPEAGAEKDAEAA